MLLSWNVSFGFRYLLYEFRELASHMDDHAAPSGSGGRFLMALSAYVQDGWNWLEAAAYLTSLGTCVMMCAGTTLAVTQTTAAAATLLNYTKVLYYMSGFKTTAPMVRMVLAVMRDIRPFLVLIMVLWFGNGLAFRMLFESSPHMRDPNEEYDIFLHYGTVQYALYTSYGMIFYDTDTSVFKYTTYPVVTWLLFIFYNLLQTIILINMLIAVMADSYAEVRRSSNAEGRRMLCKMLLQFEADETKTNLYEEKGERWVHILVPKEHGNRQRLDNVS